MCARVTQPAVLLHCVDYSLVTLVYRYMGNYQNDPFIYCFRKLNSSISADKFDTVGDGKKTEEEEESDEKENKEREEKKGKRKDANRKQRRK